MSGKHCYDCDYQQIDVIDHPCNVCEKHSEWMPKTPRNEEEEEEVEE